ncbi:MAG: hypothetical protein R6W48_04580 [Gaiellaceae bacterium]
MPRHRTLVRLTVPAGAVLGVATGALLIALGGATASRTTTGSPDGTSQIEATHLPQLLTPLDERVELGYDAYCLPADDREGEEACDVVGSAFVRSGDRGAFRELPLRVEPARSEGRLVTAVPDAVARSPQGFSYYAVLVDRATGASVTLPAGGADAPQRSLPLGKSVDVDLGTHRFGSARDARARIADARWGAGPLDAGLEQGKSLPPIGASSFDVASDGSVYVLDEAKRRALRWSRGAASPTAIPLEIDGTIADLAVSDTGHLYVLETSGPLNGPAHLRSFTLAGRALATTALADRAYRVDTGPAGAPFVLGQTSGQWMRAGAEGARLAPPNLQRLSGRPGRSLRGGGEVVVHRIGNEVRAALVGPGAARRMWRIRSDTALAEVQLAEPIGSRLVLVTRVYADARDEFLVLVLGAKGLVERFSVASADWAETAPLSRFRLEGSSLYQLGSTPAGLFVDRFDLEEE